MLQTNLDADVSLLDKRKTDLSNLPFFELMLKNKVFIKGLQFFNLIVLSALIYYSWGLTGEATRYTNLGSWVVWVIWWPFVIGSALLAGRLWCTMCHLRLISDWCSSIGAQKDIPPYLKHNFGSVSLIMLFGLVVLHSSVVSFDVHHIPHYTAIYLLILVAYAMLVSFIFKKGSFCKLFCPLVSFFSPYSLFSPTELRSGNKSQCYKCHHEGTERRCLENCPNDIIMQKQISNDTCLLCFQCVNSCENYNIRLNLR